MTTGYLLKQFQFALILTLISVLFIAGCGSSQAVVEDDDWAHQREQERVEDLEERVNQLERENTELREELVRSRQENRSLNARIAELEKRLLEERERRQALEEAPEPEPEPVTITPDEFENQYNRAINLFNNRQYEDAKNLFSRLLDSGVDHPLIPNCQYWIGETHYGMGEYRQAIDEFQKVFDYRSQLKHDDAQIMIANSYKQLGDNERARQAYQRLIDRYPNSEYINFARQQLGAL